MKDLAIALKYEVWIFLLGLVLLVSYQLLTGRINMRGLLSSKDHRAGLSPARLQLLVFTLGGVLYYLMLVIDNKKQGQFPDIPGEFLVVIGGSHMFYLGSKLFSLLAEVVGLTSSRKEVKRAGGIIKRGE